jgi:hypothetical protein
MDNEGIQTFGNELGTYMDVDMSFISIGRMSMACILVSLNFRKGLSEEIELTWGDRVFMQKMDYEGIPFKCHMFHKHGHKATECTLPMTQKGKGLSRVMEKKRGLCILGRHLSHIHQRKAGQSLEIMELGNKAPGRNHCIRSQSIPLSWV